ncbi:MAG TPA: carbohydrate binding domain-containing protein [Polyangiaceae bacterium]
MHSHAYSVVFVALTACASQQSPSALALDPTAPPPKTEIPVTNREAPPTCPSGTKPAADGLIDDFEAAQTPALGGRTQSWWVAAADRAKIEFPGKTFMAADGGPTGSKKALHFKGQTSNDDAWGAAVAVNFLPSGFYDASKYSGIAFKIMSAKPNFNVRLKIPDTASHPDGGQCKKECWNSFGKELIVGTEWQDVVLMWSDLKQQPDWGDTRPPAITPGKLRDAEWTVYPGQEFDFWVDEIRFVECK